MIGQGKRNTRAATVAVQRMEFLRQRALSTTPHCTALASGTATTNGVAEAWTVSGAGLSRRIRIVLQYQTNRGVLADTVSTVVFC
jgi:hypothetical protein